METLPRVLKSLALVSFLLGSEARAGGFLASGPGARAAGMGGAFTGLADDASAVYFNPAGLAGQRGTVMAEEMPVADSGAGLDFGGGRLNYLGFIFPSRFGAVGFGLIQFAIGGIEGRENLADAPTAITTTQSAYILPYAVQFGRLSLGVTGKMVSYSLGQYKANGYGADLGAKATLYQGDWLGRNSAVTLGLAVRNAMRPTLRLFQEATPLERQESAGLAYSASVFPHYREGDGHVVNDRLTVAFDVTRGDLAGNMEPAVGAEYSFLDRYAARLGFSTLGNITVGIGLGGQASTFRLDYAVEMAALTPQHRFTLSWLFTAPAESVIGDTSLTNYRSSVLDAERLRDRFVREGREAAVEGNYETAFTDFNKAHVLDPQNEMILKLLESAREGRRLAGVKSRLDAARRDHAAGRNAAAARQAIEAVEVDPDSRDAKEYASNLRNTIISSGTVADFDFERARVVDAETHKFQTAREDHNFVAMRQALARIKAIHPDAQLAWKPLEEALAAEEGAWSVRYAQDAEIAFRKRAAADMSRAVRRLRRVDPARKELALLCSKLGKIARNGRWSLFDGNYLDQLYNAAAASFSIGDYASAAKTLAVLLKTDAAHAYANALVDTMRQDGSLSDAEEP